MEIGYEVQTAGFQGPLEELADAARSQDVPLREVSLTALVMDFAQHLDSRAEELPLGPASEYLMVFSELVRIKCRFMVPSDDPDEEPDEKLEELREQEVGFFQEVAGQLRQQAEKRSRLYDTEPEVPDDVRDGVTNYQEVTLFELLQAFQEILDTQVEKEFPDVEVTDEYNTEDRIEWMKDSVPVGERRGFRDLISPQPTREEIIVTFLAVLHLVKAGRLRLVRAQTGGDIQVLGTDDDETRE